MDWTLVAAGETDWHMTTPEGGRRKILWARLQSAAGAFHSIGVIAAITNPRFAAPALASARTSLDAKLDDYGCMLDS